MKVAIITPGVCPLPAVKGGAVETLVDKLIQFNESSYCCELIVYSVYDKIACLREQSTKNTTICYIKRNKIIDWLFIHKIIPVRWMMKCFINQVCKRIKKYEYDVIIIENELFMGKRIKKIAPPKINLFLHLHNHYITPKSKNMLKNYDKIITISDFLKSKIKEVNATIKVSTIHNGIDLNKFNKQNIEIKQQKKYKTEFGISEKEIVIVFAARIVPEKGINELLTAFLTIADKYKIKLLIVGDSFFEGSKSTIFIKHLKNRVKDNKKVVFTGYIPYDKMPLIYSLADIGCIPSFCEEGFCLTVVEQMAMGLPLIVSDSGAITEIVTSKCAITVKRNDQFEIELKKALEKLIDDRYLREKMGSQAVLRAKKFSDRYYSEKFFREILE